MGAMMKYMNDPAFLAKVGEKLGDVPVAAQPPPAQQQAPPEINTLIDAARSGHTSLQLCDLLHCSAYPAGSCLHLNRKLSAWPHRHALCSIGMRWKMPAGMGIWRQ